MKTLLKAKVKAKKTLKYKKVKVKFLVKAKVRGKTLLKTKVKAKKKMAMVTKCRPKGPISACRAFCVKAMPCTALPGSNWPEIRIMVAVQVQITRVSIKTPSI